MRDGDGRSSAGAMAGRGRAVRHGQGATPICEGSQFAGAGGDGGAEQGRPYLRES